ncbi:MAG: hypothetical protein FJ297_12395 [Planctomycetes bacterium]|nr:hypothetical protein [Planctomycetota bacterium]
MRRGRQPDLTPGQDSFLDVVANLVGILIILIMIVGARAREALVDVVPEATDTETTIAAQAADLKSVADSVEHDTRDMAAKLERQDLEIAYRQKERDKLLVRLTAFEKEIASAREKLGAAEQSELDAQRRTAELEQDLDELGAARGALENATGAASVIEHLPTPMAKTVFGTELHVRLARGRLVVLPWEELVDKLKDEAQQQLWKLKNAPSITETAGPVEGFRIRYTLRQSESSIESKVGPVIQRHVELDRFELIPVSDDLGEPIETALRDGSRFMAHLGNADPKRTTITVWVYPENFDQFRSLKSMLYQRGFLSAARPMPEGVHIGGSPHGTRSSAQ